MFALEFWRLLPELRTPVWDLHWNFLNQKIPKCVRYIFCYKVWKKRIKNTEFSCYEQINSYLLSGKLAGAAVLLPLPARHSQRDCHSHRPHGADDHHPRLRCQRPGQLPHPADAEALDEDIDIIVVSSVADPNPDPSDPYVFGPPGSGSGSNSQRYGCGSFYHQSRIIK